MDGDEVFIIDDEIVTRFFKNENYENAQMFFDYLTVMCKTKKACMIPLVFKRVTKKIKEKTKEKGDTIQTEIVAWFRNWVEEVDLLGVDQGEEEHDTILLYKILKVLNPDKKVIILSSKYQEKDVESLKIEELQSYLLAKEDFVEYLKLNYGYEDGASY